MANNPLPSPEDVRKNLQDLARQQYAAFVHYCKHFDLETKEGPLQSQMAKDLNRGQSTISEHLRAACEKLGIPYPPKDGLSRADMQYRNQLLTLYSQIIKEDEAQALGKTQSQTSSVPITSETMQPPQVGKGIDGIFESVKKGEAPPVPSRRIILTPPVIVGIAAVLALVAVVLWIRSLRQAALPDPIGPTQTARVERVVVRETVLIPVLETVEVPKVTVVTAPPQIVIVEVTPTPAPATNTPEGPSATLVPPATGTATIVPLLLPFTDDFESTVSDQWLTLNGEWIIREHKLKVTSEELTLQLNSPSLRDYVVEMDYSLSERGRIELDLGPNFRFVLDKPPFSREAGCTWQLLQNGNWVDKDHPTCLPLDGRLRVEAVGDRYRVSANNSDPSEIIYKGIAVRQPLRLHLRGSERFFIDNFRLSVP